MLNSVLVGTLTVPPVRLRHLSRKWCRCVPLACDRGCLSVSPGSRCPARVQEHQQSTWPAPRAACASAGVCGHPLPRQRSLVARVGRTHRTFASRGASGARPSRSPTPPRWGSPPTTAMRRRRLHAGHECMDTQRVRSTPTAKFPLTVSGALAWSRSGSDAHDTRHGWGEEYSAPDGNRSDFIPAGRRRAPLTDWSHGRSPVKEQPDPTIP